MEHLEVLDLDLDLSYERSIGTCHLNCLGDRAGSTDVVVLDEDTVGQVIAVVRAAADSDSVLFERTHVRSGLSGVEELRVVTLEFFCHGTGEGSDTAHALQEVKSCSFTAQYCAAVADENADDISLMDLVAVLEVGAERGVVA